MRCVGRQRERISTQMLSAMSADLWQAAAKLRARPGAVSLGGASWIREDRA